MSSPTDNTTFDQTRLDKIRALREQGHIIFPTSFDRQFTVGEIKTKYADIAHDKSESSPSQQQAGSILSATMARPSLPTSGTRPARSSSISGRTISGRPSSISSTSIIERGDIIGVTGHVFRTKLGEITIWVDTFTLLCKAVCSLPEKFHGLTDVEKRYRQRYVDLIVNEESRQTFRNRSRIVSLIRRYLDDHGFLEFETPILQPIYGGANARPFTSYHNFLDQNLFLRIAPELYLKRLVVGGFEKVFEIARNFRNEAVDADHNPEFSMVEIYWAYRDFKDMMALTEDIVSSIILELHGKYEIPFGEITLDFKPPWKKLSMADAVKEIAGIDIFTHSVEELRALARQHQLEDPDKPQSQREFLIAFFEGLVEEKLIQPTFIYDYPVENSPLAKRHRSKEGFTERFELFIAGMEVGNGFSELNDPVDQKERFEAQDEKRRLGDVEAQMIDYDFINAIGYGMPPTGGVGIGIDRLVMLLTNNDSIKEVILFPSMKKLQGVEGEEQEHPNEIKPDPSKKPQIPKSRFDDIIR